MNRLQTIILAILASSILFSCKKEQGIENDSGRTLVSVKSSTIAHTPSNDINPTNSKSQEAAASIKGTKHKVNKTKTFSIPFGDELQITAEFSVDSLQSRPSSATRELIRKEAQVSKRGETVQEDLDSGIKYRLLVYEGNNYIAEREISVGAEAQVEPFELDGGKKYTFIGVSTNSKEVPQVDQKQSLAQARLKSDNRALLWYKEDVEVKTGNNLLNVVLKNMLSQIRVSISTGALGGRVESVGKVVFENSRKHATLNLQSGAVAFSSTREDATAEFANQGRASLATTLAIASPSLANGNLLIEALNINGLTQNLEIPDLSIEPGYRYNLNLTVNAPCTELVFLENFNLKENETKTFRVGATDYGFFFDVFSLDNSLNLTINGEPLLKRKVLTQTRRNSSASWSRGTERTEAYDLQFVRLWTDVPPLVQNLRFAKDKRTWYGDPSLQPGVIIPEIYFIKGTKEMPIFRIHITKDGEINLMAARKSMGVLEDVEVITSTIGPVYNNDNKNTIRYYYTAFLNDKVKWKKTGTNVVVASQVQSGPTHMIGRGYGRKKIDCQ